jgi:tetratricopeptide (TPR) repeat protein
LLEGLQFLHSPAYEVWLLGERRRLAAATETLLQEAALSAMSIGNLADAVRWANRLVGLNPRVDSHQELLIRAYAISGDHAAARRQLESAVRLFRRELSCDPAPPVFLAAETLPVKTTGPASPARVHALVEAGQAQVAAGATDAAIQVMRTACDEAARTGNPAPGSHRPARPRRDPNRRRHGPAPRRRARAAPDHRPGRSIRPAADRRFGIPAPGRVRRAARLLQPGRPPARRGRSHHGP